MRNLLDLTKRLAMAEYESENGYGAWDELCRHEREDLVFAKYNELEKENSTKKKECKNMKRTDRMNALKNAGINTNGFFNVNLQIPVGSKVEIKVDGKPMTFEQDWIGSDYVEKLKNDIADDGYVKNTRLWRRFITAQTFRMLNYDGPKGEGWDAALKNFDYKYQFEMLLEELRVQKILYNKDRDAYEERNQFFNKDVAVALCEQYIRQLLRYVKMNTINGKDGKYVKLAKYGKVYINDLYGCVFYPMRVSIILPIRKSGNPDVLYHFFEKFIEKMNKLPRDTTKCEDWKTAFKAAGAFYTLKNLIMFHDIILDGCSTMEESVDKLNGLAKEYSGKDGWRLHKYMVKVIRDNNFDLATSIEKHK